MQSINEFIPFFGSVENVNDPLQCGRMQVRVKGFHSDNHEEIPTEFLPWFHSVVNNSSGAGGYGNSPTGYAAGSIVFGMFFDRDKQGGLILGAIPGAPGGVSDVSGLGTNNGTHWLKEYRDKSRVSGVSGPLAENEQGWSQPEYKNQSQYPLNDVYQGQSGIVREYDNTPGNERIHEFHPSGTYREILPDGSNTVHINGNNFEVIVSDNNVFIGGSVNLTINSNCNMHVRGNYNLQVDGNKTEVVQGDCMLSAGSTTIQGQEGVDINSAGKVNLNEG